MGKKILVVDDEPEVLESLQVRLEANDFDVVTAENGTQALAQVKAENPALIILDVTMPDINGFQVCRQLKDDGSYRHIPVILLTAKSTESDEFWGIEAGADAYLTKPFNADELLAKIAELLKG